MKLRIRLEYVTSSEASGVQWLLPEQTAGKAHPFLFTQCQAIHARSVMPCQDTPAYKCTYTASITVPEPLTGVYIHGHFGDGLLAGCLRAYQPRDYSWPVLKSSRAFVVCLSAHERRVEGQHNRRRKDDVLLWPGRSHPDLPPGLGGRQA